MHAGTAPPPGAKLVGEQWGKAELPRSDGLVRDLEAALEQQLCDITEAELVAQAPQHGEQHDVGGVLQLIEWGAGPLFEDSVAGAASGSAVAERATSSSPAGLCGTTVGAGHGQSSAGRWSARR